MSKTKRDCPQLVKVLNFNELDSCPGKINGFLIDYKNCILRDLKKQEKKQKKAV